MPNALKPQITVDASGNAIAVWHQSDGTQDNIWANRFNPTTGWGPAEKIDSEDSGNARDPQVILDASGNAIAVWQQYSGSQSNIWANRFSPTSGWGVAEKIESDDTGSAFRPQITVDASGNAIVVWEQFFGSLRNIWANRFSTSDGWGSAELIDSVSEGSAVDPQITVDASGNALAVWHQHDGTRYSIYANRFTPSAGWAGAELLESDNVGDAFSPQIASNASGNALAVWRQYNGTRYNIYANRFSPSAGWAGAELLESDNTENVFSPQIALDASGNAIAVWTQTDGTRVSINAKRFTPSAGWTSSELIENDYVGIAGRPQVTLDASGNALAVWHQYDGTQTNIYANRFSPSSGWVGAVLIESDDAGSAERSQIAFDASGNAIAVWSQSDGTRNNIWANRFE